MVTTGVVSVGHFTQLASDPKGEPMKVAFMPLGEPRGREAILIERFPVILARPQRGALPPEAWTVSPYHCRIDWENGVLVVRDLGSKYGTYVNESRVREACLWPGSKLTVGLNSFFVCYTLPDRGASTGTGPGQDVGDPSEPKAEPEISSGPCLDILEAPDI